MATRLSNDMREAITRQAIDAGFQGRFAALDDAEDKLANRAHAAVFDAAALKAVAKLPKGWVRYDPCLNFNAQGMRIKLTAKVGLPVPYQVGGSHGYHCHASLGTIKDEALAAEIVVHAQSKEKLKEEVAQAKAALLGTLQKVSTIESLAKQWPQGAPFYGKYLNRAASLPAVRFEEINAKIGLAA